MINLIINPENLQTFDLSAGTEVLLSFSDSSDKPVPGVVSIDSSRTCRHCLLVKTDNCSDFFRCHPDDRKDGISVYLASAGEPHVQD